METVVCRLPNEELLWVETWLREGDKQHREDLGSLGERGGSFSVASISRPEMIETLRTHPDDRYFPE